MTTNSTTHAERAIPLEFLAFTLGAEEYGVDIQKVQELRGYDAVTRIANVPDYVKGVVNLRGIIAPIIDMRIKLGVGTPTYDQFTVVVIVNIAGTIMGMVVDSVSDVLELSQEQIKPVPPLEGTFTTNHLLGLGAIGERLLILLDVEHVLRADLDVTSQKLAA